MRHCIVLFVLVVILGSPLTADAAFQNFRNTPAELGSSWVGITNQREVFIDLNTHTNSLVGPIDGAVYTGDLDPILAGSDNAIYGDFLGNGLTFVEPQDQTTAVSPSGTTIVQMANPNYRITIGLENVSIFTGSKEIWVEWVSTAPTMTDASIGDWLDIFVTGSDVTVADVYHNKLDDFHDGDLDWYATNVLFHIEPNPIVETFFFTVPEPNGAQDYYVDTIAIATNCIPEPSTITIWLLLGGCGILIGRRK